jgi:ankyrin repeat protein
MCSVARLTNNIEDLRNDKGETPLHWAMRSGVQGMGVTRFLLENGARSLFNKAFKRPFDVAAAGFDEFGDNLHPVQHDFKHENEIDLVQQMRDSRKNFFMHCPQARSLVLHHPECLEHVPKYETDWECPGRVQSIMNPLLNKQIDFIQEHEIQVTTEFDKASLEFLSRVHSAEKSKRDE